MDYIETESSIQDKKKMELKWFILNQRRKLEY